MLTNFQLNSPLRRYLLTLDGDGGDGGEGGSGGGGTPPAPKGPGGSGEEGKGDKMFTQADLDKAVQKRVRETKDSTITKVAEELGVTLDEAKAIIAKAKEDETAALGATEAAKRAAEADQAEANRIKADAAQDRLNARIERKLVVAAGLDPDDDADKSKLARLLGMVASDLKSDADSAAIDEALEAVRTDFPALFEDGAGAGPGTPPPSDRGGASRRSKERQTAGGSDGIKRGMERAKAGSGSKGYTFLE